MRKALVESATAKTTKEKEKPAKNENGQLSG